MKFFLSLFLILCCYGGFSQENKIDEACNFIKKHKIDSTNEQYMVLLYMQVNQSFNLTQSEKDSLLKECPKYALLLSIYDKTYSVEPDNIEPLTDKQYINQLKADKNNDMHLNWSKEEFNTEKDKCLQDTNNDKLCSCGLQNLSKYMNHKTFIEMSNYQKGKALATFKKEYCP